VWHCSTLCRQGILEDDTNLPPCSLPPTKVEHDDGSTELPPTGIEDDDGGKVGESCGSAVLAVNVARLSQRSGYSNNYYNVLEDLLSQDSLSPFFRKNDANKPQQLRRVLFVLLALDISVSEAKEDIAEGRV
jgi:hypothetical protein